MLWQIIPVLLFVWLLIQRWRNRKIIKLAKQLKSKHKALPFIGHAYLFLGSDEDRMRRIQMIGDEALENDGLISHWQGNQLYIFVADPVVAGLVLKTFVHKDDVTRLFSGLIGNGSIFAPVSIWRPRRKILAPTFRLKSLQHFVAIFSKQSNILVRQLRRATDTGTFSVWKYLTSYMMDSVCETTLGISIDAQKQKDQPFLSAFEEVCQISAARILQPWLHNDILYKMLPQHKRLMDNAAFIRGFIKEIITKKWHSMKPTLNRNPNTDNSDKENGLKTFLELLIQASSNGKGYNNIELQEETLVIVLAGTDTTAVGASFTTVMLSKHPRVQEKVFQELKDVFGDSDRSLMPEDLPHLKYLEAVIKESLRLYPPVPIIVRKIEEDLTLPSGITLLKGCRALIPMWTIHRNPAYWGADVKLFRPERFFDSPPKHPAAFIPFSYGPRNCLGYQYATMSMKTALASILRHYIIKPSTPLNEASDDKLLRVKFDIMMKHVDNFTIQLESRQ